MENKDIHNNDWLSKLPKESGFEVPEGYFDAIEDQFSAGLREELLPKSTGFEVPQDYFDGLEDTILEKIELPKKVKVIPLRARVLRMTTIAAVITLLLTIYFKPLEQEEPSYEEIAAWIDDNMSDIDTIEIIGAFDEDTNLDESFFDDSLENNNIEKYLDENDTYILIEESPGLFDEIN